MTISDIYNIDEIIMQLEVALQIDGQDYAEKDFNISMRNIRNRIIRSYQIDLTNSKIYDDALYLTNAQRQAGLFVDNIKNLHGQLAGYLQVTMYQMSIVIRPKNVSYLGFSDKDLMSFLKLAQHQKTLVSCESDVKAVEEKLGSIAICREKRLFMIMLVAYELGFYEIFSVIAQILYLGGKV